MHDLWDFRRLLLEVWELLKRIATLESSVTTLETTVNNLSVGNSFVETVSVTSPSGSIAFTDNIVVRAFIVEPDTPDRQIDIGTTPGGSDILYGQVIPDGEDLSYTWIKYYEAPTFYFTISGDAVIHVLYDYISTPVLP